LRLHPAIGNRAVGRLLRGGTERPSVTGLPARLKAGIEALSGLSLDDVRVHYNSGTPAEVQALSYTQGASVHVGPGQENHLPHEAWHVVQQKQGRVRATTQVSGLAINDSTALEREADVMGRQATQVRLPDRTTFDPGIHPVAVDAVHAPAVVQRQVFQDANGKYYSDIKPRKTFDTYAEAEAYERDMPAPAPTKGPYTERAPTLFTYVMTPTHYQMSSQSIPQGPHTMGHAAVSTALFGADISPGALGAEQVPPPDVWRDQVIQECGANVFSSQTVLSEEVRRQYRAGYSRTPSSGEVVERFQRAYKTYNGLWQELRRIVSGQSTENARDVVDELMQLGAYSVYGYDAPRSIGKAQLRGKGENRDLTDPKNIDKWAEFRNRAAYQETIESRMQLLDDDYRDNPHEDVDYDITSPEAEPESTLMMVEPVETSGPPSSSTRSKRGHHSMLVYHEKIIVDNHTMEYSPGEVSNDSDCFFNSMIKLGYGGDVQTLRQIAQQNNGQKNITTPGTWADERDIAAIAKHFKIRIRKIVVGHKDVITQDETTGNAEPVVTVAKIYGKYFTPLRDVSSPPSKKKK
jgi:hypothetical protein